MNLFFVLASLLVYSLLISFTCAVPLKQVQDKESKSAGLDDALEKLKHNGVVIQKTKETNSETVNGNTDKEEKQSEKISNAKTGEKVASADKMAVTSGEEGVHQIEQVDIPSEDVHQVLLDPVSSLPSVLSSFRLFQKVTTRDVAQFIFDGGNIDEIKNALAQLVANKETTLEDAENYMNAVRDDLELLHSEALQAEMKAEQKRNSNGEAYAMMMDVVERLNEDEQLKSDLYDAAKHLYILHQQGDPGARDLLAQFADRLEAESRAGALKESVENAVLQIVLSAMDEVDRELVPADEEKRVNDTDADQLHQLTQHQQ